MAGLAAKQNKTKKPNQKEKKKPYIIVQIKKKYVFVVVGSSHKNKVTLSFKYSKVH